jgi:hypothetical protein
MKTPKPGQFTQYNGILYRAVRRTDRCEGCAFNNAFTCPNIVDPRNKDLHKLECDSYGIILKRV